MASRASVVNCLVIVLLHLLACTSGETTLEIFIEDGDVDNLEEGDNVTMRCECRDLGADSYVIWQHGTVNLATSDRFTITAEELGGRGDTSLDKACTLAISPVVEEDRGLYRCRIVENNPEFGERVIETEEVTLTVFTFPNDTNPQCSPSGPTTLNSGDVLAMTCSTYPGHPAVNVTIAPSDVTFRDTQWNTVTSNEGTIVRSLNWEARLAQDGAVIQCSITSTRFPSNTRTCVIGPITVNERPVSTPSIAPQPPTTRLLSTMVPVRPEEFSTLPPKPTMQQISAGFPWLYAFLVCAALLALAIAINIITCAVVLKYKKARDIYKVTKAQEAFIEKQKSKNGNLRLNGIDNTQFYPETVVTISSSSPL
ncbi:uncharacterized protein LOC117302109 [Asterias rubens]|uniref:uncharacterized protein LOC117302109 n=1 Tax=Asterias rubens TaxID=7604 RepID=UPI00145504A0|nr:uncharacterized protein LOC117302109 [Asterias rubens]